MCVRKNRCIRLEWKVDRNTDTGLAAISTIEIHGAIPPLHGLLQTTQSKPKEEDVAVFL